MQYTVVDDSFRTDEDAEMTRDLLDGKTVFVPNATNTQISVMYSRFTTRHGRKLRRRQAEVNGKLGFVIWLDEPTA